MGYTHYFSIDSDRKSWKRAWPRLVRDTEVIITTSGIAVTGPDDPEDEVEVPPPIVSLEEGIYINGVGSDAHEPLVISCKGYLSFGFVKTARKPYDLIVACVLLRAKMLAPRAVRLSSDGRWDEVGEWGYIRDFYQSVWPQDALYCPWGEDEEVGDAPDNGQGCSVN